MSKNGRDVPRPLILILLLAGIMAYFTGTRLIASVGNNIGLFELTAGLLITVSLIHFLRQNTVVHFHFVLRVLLLIILVAAVDLLKMVDRPFFGLVQWLLLLYGFALLFVLYNLTLLYPDVLKYLLRFLTYGAVLAATWVFVDGYLTGGDINAAGPFRNRVHVGIYMASAFWLLLIYLNWPGVSGGERKFLYLFIPLLLYGVAVSGRRSVYLSLGIGLIMLAISSLLLIHRGRLQAIITIILAAGFIAFLYWGEVSWLPRMDFFQERADMVDDRLRLATGSSDELAEDDNFILLQRRGMWAALQDHPLLGIGWGGFYGSKYSPTGHEMHSTPQRFLAELGLIGFVLYGVMTGYLLLGTVRLVFRARGTPYYASALLLTIALWSLHISWVYNRSITDRTYWLLIAIFLGMEMLTQPHRVESVNRSIEKETLRVAAGSEVV